VFSDIHVSFLVPSVNDPFLCYAPIPAFFLVDLQEFLECTSYELPACLLAWLIVRLVGWFTVKLV
jgi:hypothetical protein